VDAQVRWGRLVQHGQEPGERLGVVAVDALGDDLAGGDVHGGDDGDGAVPGVFELAAGIAARPAGDLGVPAGFGLDAGLLIDADQDGSGRRVQV
jgi:hypothetical protein